MTCHVLRLEAHLISIAIHIPLMAASRVSSDVVPIAPWTTAEFARYVSCYRKVAMLSTSQILLSCMNPYLKSPQLNGQPTTYKSRRSSSWVPNHRISYAVQELSHPKNKIFRHASRSSDLVWTRVQKMAFQFFGPHHVQISTKKGKARSLSYGIWSGAVEGTRERERERASKELVVTFQTQLYGIRRFIQTSL